MKKVLFLLLIVWPFSGFVFSQAPPKFNLTKDGVKPVVLTFDTSYSANQIYTKVKEWVALTYKDSNAAIRVDKENTMVKVGALKEKAWKIRTNNFDYWYELEYTLLMEIKDTKCRVTFATPEVRYKVWYNKDGTTISKFKDSEATFEASINELLTTLYTHIKDPKKKAVDDW
jgi:predicted secreted hydrolase